MSAVLTGSAIEAYRWTALKKAVQLEKVGLRKRGESALSIIRRACGNRTASHDEAIQFCETQIEEFRNDSKIQ